MNLRTAFLLMSLPVSSPGLFSETDGPLPLEIRVNQIGYFPGGPKQLPVASDRKDEEVRLFRLIQADTGEEVFRGELSAPRYWEQSGEWVRWADFTPYTRTGQLVLEVQGGGLSFPFQIQEHLYEEVLTASARMFFHQRASTALLPRHAGRFHREAGHLNTSVPFHPDLGKAPEARMASPGGWYDAGDYGKYMVNSGVTTSLLLMTADRFGDLFPDGRLNLPESGNGIPDLLDEIRYQLDWILTLQDGDGGVFFKVTPLRFAGKKMPSEDPSEHVVIGKSTSSTLNFAAVLAYASVVYRETDSAFADRCLSKAERAMAWARANPEVVYTQGEDSETYRDVRTGGYGDDNFGDEFLWARTALFLATGNESYRVDPSELMEIRGPSWRDVGALSVYLISHHPEVFDAALVERAQALVSEHSERLLSQIERHPYRICRMKFPWASNTGILDAVISLSFAYDIQPRPEVLRASVELLDYLFGKNAVGMSFVTGFGSQSPRFPHHRIMIADGIEDPIPGYLVGGPNQERQDARNVRKAGGYAHHAPAKSYLDHPSSYASNEVAINWNAPLVFALSFVEYQRTLSNEWLK